MRSIGGAGTPATVSLSSASPSAAREKVRVARALKDLSEMPAAFAKGELTYSKVRALTRVATRHNEAELLALAMTTTAARVEERCRQMRNVLPTSVEDASRSYGQRALRLWRDEHRGTLTLTVELPIEEGELVARALDKGVESLPGEGPEFESTSWQAQQADALVAMARHYLAGGADSASSAADHYQVVVHVDAAALAGGEGCSDQTRYASRTAISSGT